MHYIVGGALSDLNGCLKFINFGWSSYGDIRNNWLPLVVNNKNVFSGTTSEAI